jgi:hypothetical protein
MSTPLRLTHGIPEACSDHGGNRGDLGVRHCDLRVERGEFQMLQVLIGAIVAARKRED